jgi:pimeloyl-ACP methyl ester carboxylesterase
VLLHSHGLSGGQWRKLTGDLVAHGFRVLAVPLAGHGRSEPWPEPKPFSFAIDVERVGEVVRAVQPAHVVGHSYGGLIALHVARGVPGGVATLSLFDPVAFGVLDADEDRDARAVLEALDLSWPPRPSSASAGCARSSISGVKRVPGARCETMRATSSVVSRGSFARASAR